MQDHGQNQENLSKYITVYKQDCESYRYNDKLKWSRFQTIILIESGVLIGFFQYCSTPIERFFWMILGTVIILIAYLLAFKDGKDEEGFLKRIRNFEQQEPKAIPYEQTCSFIFGGSFLTGFAVGLLIAFNIFIAFFKCM